MALGGVTPFNIMEKIIDRYILQAYNGVQTRHVTMREIETYLNNGGEVEVCKSSYKRGEWLPCDKIENNSTYWYRPTRKVTLDQFDSFFDDKLPYSLSR